MKTLEMGNLPKGDFENYLQNGDMVKVTWRFDKNDKMSEVPLDQSYSATTVLRYGTGLSGVVCFALV
jgi:hypothetical protein